MSAGFIGRWKRKTSFAMREQHGDVIGLHATLGEGAQIGEHFLEQLAGELAEAVAQNVHESFLAEHLPL